MIFLINISVPVTLYGNMLTFTDSNKPFEWDGDLLKTNTNYNFNVDHSNPQDQKILYEFGKETKFDIKQIGWLSTRNKSLIKLPKSPAIIAFGISTIFSLENPNELWNRLKFLLQGKRYSNISSVKFEEKIAIVDKVSKDHRI